MSSSRRRACLNGRTNSSGAECGTRTATMTSSGCRSTLRYPLKKSATSSCRVPRAADAMVSDARQATSRGFMSEMGDAVARFPPRHATFRIWVDANQRSMSWMARLASHECAARLPAATSQRCSISLRGAHAPRSSASGVSEQLISSLTAVVHSTTSHVAFLKRRSIPSSVLPATSRPAGYAALRARRSARVLGRHQQLLPEGVLPWMRSGPRGLRRAEGKSGSFAAASLATYGVLQLALASLSALSLVNSTTGAAGSALDLQQPPPSLLLQPPEHARRSASEQRDLAASQIGR
mmetsp:Transcript_27390/g.68048  ORF Transcript_27390/g.68048 Transcript_27390/m.68048 type:complete len:294 (+) Transcript_27390:3437-4318(+)